MTHLAPPDRFESYFLPPALVQQARRNFERFPEAKAERDRLVAAAEPWKALSDEYLWGLMFGNTIKRAWQVWSNGHCPSCKKGVPMYNWKMNAVAEPWKTRCPHCNEAFPKNDFGKYYQSGLDGHGVFDPNRADRRLLFNTEHPDPSDPLHAFGVDDGEGFVEGDHRWRFIGAYLIFGQWKQAIYGGIRALADAYTVTGDPLYAHKVGVLLDRVADLYPSHDFGKQGVMYEGPPRAGYVSTWHDACEETRQIAFAYDKVKAALAADQRLADFLAAKAKAYGIAAPKATPADVLAHIEQGLLVHPQENQDRIYSNFPQTPMTVAVLKTVRNGPGDREAAREILAKAWEEATLVDGVTGEKGLTGYAVFATSYIANVLALYARAEPAFLDAMLARVPNLPQMYRFFLDVWYQKRLYPNIGDTGAFGYPNRTFVGVAFTRSPGLGPSMYALMWQFYERTGDVGFVQALWHGNDGKPDGLPHDLFVDDPAAFQKKAAAVIRERGATPQAASVDKKGWHLAMLRAGRGEDERALWIDYDAGGYHSHGDALNLGLFAYGIDFLPDFGYPPVQFGGWGAPRAVWYTLTAAHNTVVVDGKTQRNLARGYPDRSGFEGKPFGRTTLWQVGDALRAVRAECPDAYEGLSRYERTVALVEISPSETYLVDLFRVAGGTDHARFFHGPRGVQTASGLKTAPGADFGNGAQMRAFRTDPSPAPGAFVDWTLDDPHGLLAPGAPAHLRLFDLTAGAAVSLAEAWVTTGGVSENEETWIGSVVTRRSGPAPLASTFVAVLEPYRGKPRVARTHRLPLENGQEDEAAVEVTLADGRKDLFIFADPAAPGRTLRQRDWDLAFDGDLAWVRRDAGGAVERVALRGGGRLTLGELAVTLQPGAAWVEVGIEQGRATLLAGAAEAIESVTRRGKRLILQRRAEP